MYLLKMHEYEKYNINMRSMAVEKYHRRIVPSIPLCANNIDFHSAYIRSTFAPSAVNLKNSKN